jgi:hypothetical protein
MKALSTKQATEEGPSEKGLFAARAFPVRDPEGNEKINNKRQSKRDGGDDEQAPQLRHGAEK